MVGGDEDAFGHKSFLDKEPLRSGLEVGSVSKNIISPVNPRGGDRQKTFVF